MAAIAAGCGLTPPETVVPSLDASSADAFDRLATRAVALPLLEAAGPCPVDTAGPIEPRIAPALGSGPVYPVMGGARISLAGAVRGPFERFGLKTLWVSVDPVDERVLIRVTAIRPPDRAWPGFAVGHRPLDGIPSELRLGPESNLQFGGGPMPEGWRAWSSSTLVDGPGCYSFQIDTARRSANVIFEVVP